VVVAAPAPFVVIVFPALFVVVICTTALDLGDPSMLPVLVALEAARSTVRKCFRDNRQRAVAVIKAVSR